MKLRSRRLRAQLGSLQSDLMHAASERNVAFRILLSSRYLTTPSAQREFWLEFSWLDQEYRMAVRRLAQFCMTHARSHSSLDEPHSLSSANV